MDSPRIALDSSGGFLLTLKSPTGDTHSVVIPETLEGLRALRRILSAHQRNPKAKLGADAAPIQYMVDQWLRAAAKEKEKKHDEFLASLNIDITL